MRQKRPHIAPLPVPVINVVAAAMPLPTTISQVILSAENESMMKLLEELRIGQDIHVMAVMSKPGIETMPDRLHEVGVLCSVPAVSIDSTHIVLKGECRVTAAGGGFIKKDEAPDSYFTAIVGRLRDDDEEIYFEASYQQIRADLTKVKRLLRRFHDEAIQQGVLNVAIIAELLDNFENIDFGDRATVDIFVWGVLGSIPELIPEDKQLFLESKGLLGRIGMMIEMLDDQLQMLARHRELDNSGKALSTGKESSEKKDSRNNEDSIFEREDIHPEIKSLWKRFKEIRDFMPEDAQIVVKEDLNKLLSFRNPQANFHEWPLYKNHLDFMLGLPWNTQTGQKTDINLVAQALDEDHYGLKHPKERICDGIAPKILNPEGKGQILCFIGPPGVGKTSLAKSIARALSRKLIRMSVGGIRDEAQIRGHRITYIGSQPGEIVKLIRRCGAKDPVFVIDEVDKIGKHSVSGDPSSALLEVLDPEQNFSFRDHYLNCGFDLSKVMFICTANVADEIHPALKDRMDIIRLPGYLPEEKLEITKRYFVSKWTGEVGLAKNKVQVVFSEEVIQGIIQGYTSEAGVRKLENLIAAILRKIARRYLELRDRGNPFSEFIVTENVVSEFLGPVKVFMDKARPTKIGEAIGLAWTEVGGSILYVQSVMYPSPIGKKVFARTGMQGDVMKEADEVAMTLNRKRFKEANSETSKEWRKSGVHLHIPEGAIPKDGPSAGLTVFASLHSLGLGRSLRPFIAMTGEIDLMENVLPVGGIREKVVAAERAGVKEVILPKANERNLYDVPESTKENLTFHFVETIDEMVEVAFEKQ